MTYGKLPIRLSCQSAQAQASDFFSEMASSINMEDSLPFDGYDNGSDVPLDDSIILSTDDTRDRRLISLQDLEREDLNSGSSRTIPLNMGDDTPEGYDW